MCGADRSFIHTEEEGDGPGDQVGDDPKGGDVPVYFLFHYSLLMFASRANRHEWILQMRSKDRRHVGTDRSIQG